MGDQCDACADAHVSCQGTGVSLSQPSRLCNTLRVCTSCIQSSSEGRQVPGCAGESGKSSHSIGLPPGGRPPIVGRHNSPKVTPFRPRPACVELEAPLCLANRRAPSYQSSNSHRRACSRRERDYQPVLLTLLVVELPTREYRGQAPWYKLRDFRASRMGAHRLLSAGWRLGVGRALPHCEQSSGICILVFCGVVSGSVECCRGLAVTVGGGSELASDIAAELNTISSWVLFCM